MITASEARSVSEDESLRYRKLLEKLSLAIYRAACRGDKFYWIDGDYDERVYMSEVKPFSDRLKSYLESHGYEVMINDEELTINW